HAFPVEPSGDTLSLYIIFMSHYVKSSSISTYLSSIVHELEPFYPNVRDTQNSPLVQHCSTRIVFVERIPPSQYPPPHSLLLFICTSFQSSLNHDLLCITILVTAFYGLLCLGEFVLPDNASIQDPVTY
ncbi:hypothetical protein BDQ17DRAFT_1257433, partial [Cyathus striatus]